MRVSEGSEVSEEFLDLLKNNGQKGNAVFSKIFSLKNKKTKKRVLYKR